MGDYMQYQRSLGNIYMAHRRDYRTYRDPVRRNNTWLIWNANYRKKNNGEMLKYVQQWSNPWFASKGNRRLITSMASLDACLEACAAEDLRYWSANEGEYRAILKQAKELERAMFREEFHDQG